MDFQGTLKSVSTPETITSKAGKTYNKVTFVLNLPQEGAQYPQTIAIETLNDNVINYICNCPIGTALVVRCDVEAREWQGKFFNSLKAWNVTPVQ